MGLQEQFTEELAVIKRAPITFFIGFVVLAVCIGVGEYQFFVKESLARKDDAIRAKDDLIKTLQDKLATKAPTTAAPDKPTTGAATVTGDGSTANTGSGNTFGQPSTPKQKKK